MRKRLPEGKLGAFLIPALLAAFVLGGLSSWALFGQSAPQKFTGGVLYQAHDTYQFIDPLLACDIGTEDSFADLYPLKSALSATVDQSKATGSAQSVSVYFRSLNDAHWFDIDPNATYVPASLLKTFIMMSYFQEARGAGNASLLGKQIPFQGSGAASTDEQGNPIPYLMPGKFYSVSDVIKQMIIYSDNDALNTLLTNADAENLQISNQIFSDLQIASPLAQGQNVSDFMSVDQYAMVFRVLYGATYLSRTYSEQALGLLSQAAYKDGLVAGVPSSVTVAHKYGYYYAPATASAPAKAELHDCGIVYYPGHPYILCVMTRGTDNSALQATIKDISAETYQQVQKLYAQ